MMEFNIINHGVSINDIRIDSIGSSSNFTVGDIEEIRLVDAFETPPENQIVGVTIPLVPPQAAAQQQEEGEAQ